MRSVRFPFLAALAVLAASALAGPAAAQCVYPTLADDVPQAFAATPQRLRFTQADARWAAVAVRSDPGANWDIGLSVTGRPFPACIDPPVVTSTQASGIDFVLGDFAAEGTGVRYAPIQRTGGAGGATVEWDSGSRTAVVGPPGNGGFAGLIDCWNVDLVAGTSYKIRFIGNDSEDHHLYVFRHGGANSWRSKADALYEYASNLSFSPVLTAPVSERYAFVVVREPTATGGYAFSIQECVDPPHLEPHASLPIPILAGYLQHVWQFEPGGPGFPTVATRVGQEGDFYTLEVSKHVAAGYYPCEGEDQAITNISGTQRVELMVGDQVSGAVPLGGSWWLGASPSTSMVGRVEYSPGTDVLTVDGPTQYVQPGMFSVARTYRADLVAGTNYRFHVAKCGTATGRLYVFRPFDTAFPDGNGWSQLSGNHEPIAAFTITGVNDFTLTPPVTGAYAVVITNETGENTCWELGISTCRLRTDLVDRVPATLVSDPPIPYVGELYGTLHFRGGWSAVGVRPFALGEDWVVEAWDTPTGGDPAPLGCLNGLLGISAEDGTTSPTDFLARYDWGGESKENVETVRIYPAGHDSPGGGAHALYEQWNLLYSVGDPPVLFFTGTPVDLLEVVNIDLVGGQTYSFLFEADGFHGEMFLFQPLNTCSGVCPQEYASPGSAGMQFRTTTTRVFTAPATGTYGVVIVNQNGGAGRFWFAVNATTVDVSLPAPVADTRFVGAAPNPVAAGSTGRLDFELARPARVGFDLVNLAGRVVTRVEDAPFGAGRSTVAWTPQGLTPGLYFVRMRVDGETRPARTKLTVLP